jgi:hypothetical protein
MFAMKWFLGLNKASKTIMSILIVPLVLLLVILILEKLLKFLWFTGDKVSNAISHVFSKDNRVAYMLVSVLMLMLGGYLEYSYNFIIYTIDFWENVADKYNSIMEYIEILIKF